MRMVGLAFVGVLLVALSAMTWQHQFFADLARTTFFQGIIGSK